MISPVWSDFLSSRPFQPVVAGAYVRALRRNRGSEEARDFVDSFLGFDPRSHFALRQTFESLGSEQAGGAFWVNGAFGSGKSHFLGVLALACDGVGRTELRANFPELAPALDGMTPRLVVYIPLDEYNPTEWSLEEIFWREARLEWEKRIPIDKWPAHLDKARAGSRAEALEALVSILAGYELDGVAIFFDETSLFLGGRGHRELQGDASFLQFLGQSARRERVWVVAALQKTIDDLGGLEPYALGQIRDRFQTLPLSLAHLPALIPRRLVEVKDERGLDEWCAETLREREARFGTLPFGSTEWRYLAPFHPTAIELLEAVAGRFLSRTRSALLFCSHQLQTSASTQERVTPDAIWDYFAPEIEGHPDWSVLSEAESAWNEWIASVPETEQEALTQTAKFLLLCRVAGRSTTAHGLGQALDFQHENPSEWARYLLEKLRRGAGFLAHERGDDPLQDRYALDLGKRVGESARRMVVGAASEIEEGDARLTQAALGSCKSAAWPLGELGDEGRSMTLFWRHSPRRVRLGLWHEGALTAWTNRLATLRDGGDAALLLFWPPFASPDGESAGEALAPLARGAVQAWGDERAKSALWAWRPRTATRDEWELSREVAGALLTRQDPNLLDNRRGRAILEHLERERPAREAALERVVRRLYREGEVVLGSGAVIEASELAGGDDFLATLESVADFALPHLFPRFGAVAPRARVLTPSNADALCLELLRRPANEPFFAPSLERLARHLGEPLGVATPSAGRWKMAPGDGNLMTHVLSAVGLGAALSQLSAGLSLDEWGVPEPMLDIVLSALLRAGELVALDARGQSLAPATIGLPLRRSIHRVVRGSLPDSASWTKLAVVAKSLFDAKIGPPSFEEAARLTAQLEEWREETQGRLELARARAAQLRRSLGQSPAQWSELEAATSTVAGALQDAQTGDQTLLLQRAAGWDVELLSRALRESNRFAAALDGVGELLSAHALLSHSDLRCPPDLAPERAALLEELASGEGALFNDELKPRLRDWRASYAEAYANWHGAQNDSARWNSLARLERSDELKGLERMATLARRRFDVGPQLKQELGDALEKRCPRPDAARVVLASGEAVCNACALKWGERVVLPDPRALEQRLQTALEAFRASLHEPQTAKFLERRAPELLEADADWSDLLSSEHLALLDEAFAPRRRVTRSLDELRDALSTLQTRREWEVALLEWLDGGDGLGDEDELELEL
ncbi:hypothetical protein IAD21_04645 [Abditibacteriota bacterium]|nr:hypothetical protein IAD21_04645 [Abditibacteriota bacterium]